MDIVKNKVAVVTGESKGLGEAIALGLAEEGANLMLGDIDADGLASSAADCRDAGASVGTLVGDVTEESPAAALVQGALDQFGQLDILVNNAGVLSLDSIEDMTVD